MKSVTVNILNIWQSKISQLMVSRSAELFGKTTHKIAVGIVMNQLPAVLKNFVENVIIKLS